ncbi:MAG: DUF2523 domain-containing protein [Nitrospirae bacterium]|nr:DUF2523 domain-containing protein [Nitrospirota bacterium]
MNAIINFFASFWEFLKSALSWTVGALGDVMQGVLSVFFEGFFAIVYALVASLDLGTYTLSLASTWGALPTQAVYLLNAIGIPQGLTMLAYAYGIRLILNLIPASITRV